MSGDVEPRWKTYAPAKKGRKRLRPFSMKRGAAIPDRQAFVEAILRRDGYRCTGTGVVPQVACGGPLDVHEVIPRSAWRAGWLVAWNCRVLCRAHHDWVGDNPEAAHRVGLHGYSWERSTDG